MEDKFKHLRLVQTEENKIVIQNEQLKKDICSSIASGQCTVPEDIVNLFNISYENAIQLLNDPGFLGMVKKQTMAKLNLTFHTTIPNKLNEIITKGDYKEAMQGMKLAAQLTDNLKNIGADINFNVTVENLVKESEKTVNVMDTEFRKVS
jgi:hypothetical protein